MEVHWRQLFVSLGRFGCVGVCVAILATTLAGCHIDFSTEHCKEVWLEHGVIHKTGQVKCDKGFEYLGCKDAEHCDRKLWCNNRAANVCTHMGKDYDAHPVGEDYEVPTSGPVRQLSPAEEIRAVAPMHSWGKMTDPGWRCRDVPGFQVGEKNEKEEPMWIETSDVDKHAKVAAMQERTFAKAIINVTECTPVPESDTKTAEYQKLFLGMSHVISEPVVLPLAIMGCVGSVALLRGLLVERPRSHILNSQSDEDDVVDRAE